MSPLPIHVAHRNFALETKAIRNVNFFISIKSNEFNLRFLLLSLLIPVPSVVQKAETFPGSQAKENIQGGSPLFFCPPYNP